MWGDHARWIRLPGQTPVATPMILRFASDNFMEELLAILEQCPWRISEWEAQPETWRDPTPSPDPVYKTRPDPFHENLYNGSKLILNKFVPDNKGTLTPGINMSRAKKRALRNDPIKLYQAAQNRYYLVTASLVSEEKGYPDYNLNLGNNERASFVVRALVPAKDKPGTNEYAFVATPSGKAWKKAGQYIEPYEQTRKLIQGEEQLPLFPLNYADQCGRRRQILGGLIPVGKREEWMAASEYGDELQTGMINPVTSTEGGARHIKDIFIADVVEPWRALIEKAQNLNESLTGNRADFPHFSEDNDKSAEDKARILKTARDQIQTGSWYILLDFANFIEKYLNNVWEFMTNKDASPVISEIEKNFIVLLSNTKLSAECFVAVAIENFIVAKNTISKSNLWEELKAVWELEDTSDFETGTWFTLMDIATYLGTHFPNLKKFALEEISSLTDDEQKAVNRLNYAGINSLHSAVGIDELSYDRITIKHSLLEALVAVKAYEDALEDITSQYNRSYLPTDDTLWPDFLFPLADPDMDIEMNSAAIVPFITTNTKGLKGVEILVAKLNAMADMIDTLVPRPGMSPEREAEFNIGSFLDQREARFVIHCVFERPNCGPLFPALVSQPTCQLEMAPFFDPDAPAREVRIPLPVDISPAGLRKYKKNAMLLISDMLCGKIRKIKKLTLADLVLSVLPWPFHKDIPDVEPAGPCKNEDNINVGMFCSLSIPIVTLCALILMIIMVQLFDFLFRWIPYLFICLPIPGFKGKDNDRT